MKIITVCGSLKFRNKIMEITEKMALQGNCMLSIIYPANPDNYAYTDEEKDILSKAHKERIKISDAILVVNADNYIGSSTESEIEFAKTLNKEIIYYTDIINNNYNGKSEFEREIKNENERNAERDISKQAK